MHACSTDQQIIGGLAKNLKERNLVIDIPSDQVIANVIWLTVTDLAGEVELARTAFVEADNIARSGHLSSEGRKKLKYGTRTLLGS